MMETRENELQSKDIEESLERKRDSFEKTAHQMVKAELRAEADRGHSNDPSTDVAGNHNEPDRTTARGA